MKRMLIGTVISILGIGLCIISMPLQAKRTKPAATPVQSNVNSLSIASEQNKLFLPEEPNLSTLVKKDVKVISPLASIQSDLKSQQYRQDILPNNFSYLNQLLNYGVETHKPTEYAHNVFSLFSKLLKGAEYANAYVFDGLIKKMPHTVKHYFNGYQTESASRLILSSALDMLERLERTVNHIVFNKFTQDFESCKKDPRHFLDDLAHRIIVTTTQEIDMEQLRQMIIRFLEIGLNKLIWNPLDEEKTWESVKSISHHLAQLMEYNIIEDPNDLDELYWSLIHRYRLFINISGGDMSLSFYNKIKTEITSKKIMILELEEQEPFLQSKASCLLNTILAQEAKKRNSEYSQREPLLI